jgi:hypothetical protein
VYVCVCVNSGWQLSLLKGLSTPELSVLPVVVGGGTFTRAINQLAGVVVEQGATYIVRVNGAFPLRPCVCVSVSVCVVFGLLCVLL